MNFALSSFPLLIHMCTVQWRIQDFPEEGAPTPNMGAPTYYLVKNFLKTAWKWKNLDPEGRGRASLAPPLDPPMQFGEL